MRTLRNRVAVITGAANGIGRALARRFAGEGAALALVDVDRPGLAALAAELRAAGRLVSEHVLDVCDRAALAALPAEVAAEHGHVHVLVNNAGVALTGTLAENAIEDLDWIVDVNFWGVVLGCKHFLPYLLREDEAHIVNLSSLFGLVGLPSVGAYCATKAAVRSYSESLGAELNGTGVTVTCVHPGGVATEIVRRARMADESGRGELVSAFERFGIAPERAAERIHEALLNRQTRVLIGRETYVGDWLRRLAPETTNRIVAWGWQRAESRRRREAPRE